MFDTQLTKWGERRQRKLSVWPFLLTSFILTVILGFLSYGLFWQVYENLQAQNANTLAMVMWIGAPVILFIFVWGFVNGTRFHLNETYLDPTYEIHNIRKEYVYQKAQYPELTKYLTVAQTHANWANKDLLVKFLYEYIERADKYNELVKIKQQELNKTEWVTVQKSLHVLNSQKEQEADELNRIASIITQEEVNQRLEKEARIEAEKTKLKQRQLEIAAQVVAEDDLVKNLHLHNPSDHAQNTV